MFQTYEHASKAFHVDMQAQPNTAISSDAWNLVEDLSGFPARKELHSYDMNI